MSWKPKTWIAAALCIVTIAAILAIFLKSKYDSKSMETRQFTQCFAGLDTADPRLRSFHKDVVRNCVGQKWSIPRAYLVMDKSNLASWPYNDKTKSTGVDEDIKLFVTVPELSPAVMSDQEPKTSTTRILIRPMTGYLENFQKMMERKITYRKDRGAFQKTDIFKYGMRVYIDSKPELDWGEFWLVSDQMPEYYLQCPTRSKSDPLGYINAMKDGGCMVIGHVDDRVEIRYLISFVKLNNLSEIHAKVIALLRGFMQN